jgi:hypothetical protein
MKTQNCTNEKGIQALDTLGGNQNMTIIKFKKQKRARKGVRR